MADRRARKPNETRLTREQKKTRTRDRLVEAAARIFAQRGFAASSLDDIAANAGLTKGAVYSNFDSKADLAIAVLERLLDEPQLEIFNRVDPAEGVDDQFRHGSKLLAEEIAANPWFALELECLAQAVRNPELLSKLRARDDRARPVVAAALLERLIAQGKTPTIPLTEMASALIAVVNGISLEHLKDPDAMSDELIARLLAAVHAGFTTSS